MYPTQIFVDAAAAHQILDVVDATVARAFELFLVQADLFKGLIEFLGAATGIPLGLKFGQGAGYLFAVHPVAAFVRSGAFGVFYPAARHSFGDDFGQFTYAIIFL